MAKEKLKGIEGWLLVFVIFQIFGIIGALNEIVNIFSEKSQEQMEVLKSIGIVVNEMPLPMIISMNTIALALISVSLILIFRKSRYAKNWTYVAIWVDFVVSLIGIGYTFPTITYIFSGAISLAWTLYFSRSKRVKNTLVN
ncbi:DUF2569 domain-containing protein [Candidatus Pacearchaeota archaeon]|nr:DUF2569 domain-containing protein [Candidatus Pacearchaeota archaeon]